MAFYRDTRAVVFICFCLILLWWYLPVVYHQTATIEKFLIYRADDIVRLENGYKYIDNSELIHFIRDRWLVAPGNGPYNLPNPEKQDLSQVKQATFVDSLLEHKKNGFFIECGAADGKTFSNTIFFERHRNWTGLLIEPNMFYFNKLLHSGRKAFLINACLSTSNMTQRTMFDPNGLFGRVTQLNSGQYSVQCFPLYSILKAINIFHIDYFSLDVEGPEIEILKTIPWQLIDIKVLTIEYRVLKSPKEIDVKSTLAKLKKLRDFFKSLNTYDEDVILPKGPAAQGLDIVLRKKAIPVP